MHAVCEREVKELEIFLRDIRGAVYETVAGLKISAWRSREPLPFKRRFEGEKLSLRIGDTWGELFDCAWFNFKGRVPDGLESRKTALLLNVSGELCVCDGKGEPLRGLTCVSGEGDEALGRFDKSVFPLPAGCRSVDIWADAGCNDLFGNLRGGSAIQAAHIAVCHDETRMFYYDFETLLSLAKELGLSSARGAEIFRALSIAARTPRNFPEEDVKAARRTLAPALSMRGGGAPLRVSAVGHAHIDLAWLWPVRETIRKGARTFATALANMEIYPGYVFGASQPQLFQWIKEYYPGLYKRVKRKVAEGRFEVQGGMWVEADVNIPGGESLVRQILYGKRFFKEEFGADIRSLWLPDVFGYSAALPQIMRKSGMDYFMTQKLSWSLVNKFPHHSFVWRGADGSAVLAHMPPENSYNSSCLPSGVLRQERNNSDKGACGKSLMLFGIGDGGGGPGEEHLERLARMKNLAGLPPVAQEPSSKFFEKWSRDADKFPEWRGELYLERHQGTLTTQAQNKRMNRKTEIALRGLEWLAASAFVFRGAEYPAERIEALWKETLLYQFHDILPGSSIKRVYDESLERYRAIGAEISALSEAAKKSLAGGIPGTLVLNSLPWERTCWLKQGASWTKMSIPSMGFAAVPKAAGGKRQAAFAVKASKRCLENGLMRAVFRADGALESFYDKEEGREVLAGPGNILSVFYDDGDAWDYPSDILERPRGRFKLDSSRAFTDGPRAMLEQSYSLGFSRLKLLAALEENSRLLEFSAAADWLETKSLLKTSFPVDILADEASFETQFGYVSRPVHDNTSWDMAKSEVPGHKWADLSQRDYGVALLNDCKYGHRVKGNVLELSLLRGAPYPGAVVFDDSKLKPGEPNFKFGDQGRHEFKYALFPHRGDLVCGGVARAAWEFNTEPSVFHGAGGKGRAEPLSLLSVGSPDIMLESVKLSEDRKALVFRFFETGKSRVKTFVRLNFRVRSAEETNLLEEDGVPLKVSPDGRVDLLFKPFEIKTLKARPA
jgi:alpha-mannosidase